MYEHNAIISNGTNISADDPYPFSGGPKLFEQQQQQQILYSTKSSNRNTIFSVSSLLARGEPIPRAERHELCL